MVVAAEGAIGVLSELVRAAGGHRPDGSDKELRPGQAPVTAATNQAAWASALSAAASRPGWSAKLCHMRGHRV
jgi:hypothetical protein